MEHSADGSPSAPARERAGHLTGALQDRLARLGVTVGPAPAEPQAGSLPVVSPWPIESVVPGRWLDGSAGRCYVSTSRRSITDRHGAETLASALGDIGASLAALARDSRLRSLDLARAAFVDTETTGLAGGTGTYAFLIGIGSFDGDCYRVDQLFMPDPSHEEAQLRLAGELLERFEGVVTFNGRGFDLPLLSTRFRLHGLPFEAARRPHLDLLPVARRLWRGRLPSCALSVLESQVLGCPRHEDVPGWLIPARYFEYQGTGDARPLGPVFQHNVIDIVSMVSLAVRAARCLEDPAKVLAHLEDWLSLARIHLALGDPRAALAACEAAVASAPGPAEADEAVRWLGLAAKRVGAWERAVASWSALAEEAAPRRLFAFEELAKYYEHRAPRRDPARALEIVQRAYQLVAARALRPRRGRATALADLEHRRDRLARKVARQAGETAPH